MPRVALSSACSACSARSSSSAECCRTSTGCPTAHVRSSLSLSLVAPDVELVAIVDVVPAGRGSSSMAEAIASRAHPHSSAPHPLQSGGEPPARRRGHRRRPRGAATRASTPSRSRPPPRADLRKGEMRRERRRGGVHRATQSVLTAPGFFFFRSFAFGPPEISSSTDATSRQAARVPHFRVWVIDGGQGLDHRHPCIPPNGATALKHVPAPEPTSELRGGPKGLKGPETRFSCASARTARRQRGCAWRRPPHWWRWRRGGGATSPRRRRRLPRRRRHRPHRHPRCHPRPRRHQAYVRA